MYNNNYHGNRGFGGGFVVPFVLGGLTGSLLSNNRRYYPYPVYPYGYSPYGTYNYYSPYYYY